MRFPVTTPLRRRSLAGLVSLTLALAAFSVPAQADYPDRPIRIVVPFAPGGGTDLIARTMSITMQQDLGQPVVIDNRSGAATIIGTDYVAKSAPDGYTLVMATVAHAVNPSLQAKLPYDTDKAFAPVMLVGRSPNVLVVRTDSPYKSVADILAAARKNPGKLSFASQGSGTSAHLAGELFKSLGKVSMTHIPYRGAGPALTDVMAGQVDMMFATASAVGSFVEGGKLRALAVTTAERSPSASLSQVPTVAESGLPGYVADSWYGLFVPAGTPAAVIERLNAAAKKAVSTEAFRKRVESEGLVISAGSPDDFGKYVRGEELRWQKVIKSAGITAD
jgi:tripartite-type tricarboxylate transporter receptor subunit TctC